MIAYFSWKLKPTNRKFPAQNPRDYAATDVHVLSQLRAAGSDLSKPHPIDLTLIFPNGETAREFKLALPKELVSTTSPHGHYWLCEVRALIYPTPANVEAVRVQLMGLAKKYGGHYDGWGSAVVK